MNKPICDNCGEPHGSTKLRDNGSNDCDACWRSALEHGHKHGMHVDDDGNDEYVNDCPLCERS